MTKQKYQRKDLFWDRWQVTQNGCNVFNGVYDLSLDVRFHDALPWRHNGQDSVSNHQPHGCLLNRLFSRRSKKTSKLRATGLCEGNSPGLVNSPHKGPVTRKMFPFDDVIMEVVQKSTHKRLAKCPPVRLLHIPKLRRWDLCCDRLSPKGRDGGTVLSPVVWAASLQLRSIPKRPLINRVECDDRFSVIYNTFILTYAALLHGSNGVFLCASISSMHTA